METIKKLIYFCLGIYLFSSIFSNYEKGYDAAWYRESLSSWATQEEKSGYEDGLLDADMYDKGYDDGFAGKKPKYLNDDFYMDGYKDGKRYKADRFLLNW